MDKDWDEEGSVRAVLFDRKKNPENYNSNHEDQQIDQADIDSKKNDAKSKDKEKPLGD